MKPQKLLVIIATLILTGCQNNQPKESESSFSESASSSISESTSSITSETSSSQPTQTTTYKGQFYSVNDSGAITGDSSSTSFTTTVQSYFMYQGSSLITNASAPGGFAQINYIGNAGQEGRFSTMILGSQSQEGRLQLQFNCQIYKIKVEAQGYCKYIPYSDSWSVDDNCSLSVQGQDEIINLPTTEGQNSEVVTKEYVFNDYVNTLDFSTGDGRVFLNSLEITFVID